MKVNVLVRITRKYDKEFGRIVVCLDVKYNRHRLTTAYHYVKKEEIEQHKHAAFDALRGDVKELLEREPGGRFTELRSIGGAATSYENMEIEI